MAVSLVFHNSCIRAAFFDYFTVSMDGEPEMNGRKRLKPVLRKCFGIGWRFILNLSIIQEMKVADGRSTCHHELGSYKHRKTGQKQTKKIKTEIRDVS
jgi:hypothetical protein